MNAIKLTKYDREALATCRRMLESAIRSIDRARGPVARDLDLMNIGACAETVAAEVTKTQNRISRRGAASFTPETETPQP